MNTVTFQTPQSSVLPSMRKQAVVHSSQLRYSHPSLELRPCFHRLHEPCSSCFHTIEYHSFTDISISRKKEPNQQYTTGQICLSSIPWSDFHF